MKTKLVGITLLAILLCQEPFTVRGQGTFQNLDFESVNISPPGQRGFLPFTDVFPGWIGYIGTNQATQAFYNGVSLGAALSSLIGPYSPQSDSAISGYTAVLAAGEDRIINGSPDLVSAAIAQSSLLPVSAQSLRFSVGSASVVSVITDLLVTFNGQTVPFFPVSIGPNYTIYGGDISAFAGLTGELRFTERPISWPSAKVYLDNIFFSNQPIPESGTIGLLTLGALAFGWRFLSRRR